MNNEQNLISIDESYISTFGTHYWNIIHLEAFKVTLDEIYMNIIDNEKIKKRRNDFLKMFEYIITNLKCECKNHAYQILMINNHKQYKYIFQYTIDFHNQVNLRLFKPILSYETVLNQYISYIDRSKKVLNPFILEKQV